MYTTQQHEVQPLPANTHSTCSLYIEHHGLQELRSMPSNKHPFQAISTSASSFQQQQLPCLHPRLISD